MIKSVICITTAVFFIVINTVILFLKPEFTYAINDESDYCVYYQKWIRSVVFMGTIIIALFTIYFAVNLYHIIGFSLLSIECLMVIISALCKYKGIIVCGNKIKIQRLFRRDVNTTFDGISNVVYVPNARLVVKVKRNESFDVSFNSENFHKFYNSLINNDVKFKTGKIPKTDDHIFIPKYGMTIEFPKTMFREFYQCSKYLRHSRYLFSARSLEYHEHIEGYYKESSKDINDFVDIIRTDLGVNRFNVTKETKSPIDGFNFTILKAIDNDNKNKGRLAYVYQDVNSYFVIYADYLLCNEDSFINKMNVAIRQSLYLDTKYSFAKIEV